MNFCSILGTRIKLLFLEVVLRPPNQRRENFVYSLLLYIQKSWLHTWTYCNIAERIDEQELWSIISYIGVLNYMRDHTNKTDRRLENGCIKKEYVNILSTDMTKAFDSLHLVISIWFLWKVLELRAFFLWDLKKKDQTIDCAQWMERTIGGLSTRLVLWTSSVEFVLKRSSVTYTSREPIYVCGWSLVTKSRILL